MHIYEVIYLLCYLHRSERLFLDLDQLFRRLHDVYVFFLLHSNFQYSMYCFGKISSIQMYLYSSDISMGIQNK